MTGTTDTVVQAPAQSRDPPAATSRPTIPTVKAVSNDEARAALLDLVGQNFCWGKGPAKQMEFTSIRPSFAFHYTLQSFTEKRSVMWAIDPYRDGEPIDG